MVYKLMGGIYIWNLNNCFLFVRALQYLQWCQAMWPLERDLSVVVGIVRVCQTADIVTPVNASGFLWK